jgi:hypothetical protein
MDTARKAGRASGGNKRKQEKREKMAEKKRGQEADGGYGQRKALGAHWACPYFCLVSCVTIPAEE